MRKSKLTQAQKFNPEQQLEKAAVKKKKKKKTSAAIPEDAAQKERAYSALEQLIGLEGLPTLEPSEIGFHEGGARTGKSEGRRYVAYALSSGWFTFDRMWKALASQHSPAKISHFIIKADISSFIVPFDSSCKLYAIPTRSRPCPCSPNSGCAVPRNIVGHFFPRRWHDLQAVLRVHGSTGYLHMLVCSSTRDQILSSGSFALLSFHLASVYNVMETLLSSPCLDSDEGKFFVCMEPTKSVKMNGTEWNGLYIQSDMLDL